MSTAVVMSTVAATQATNAAIQAANANKTAGCSVTMSQFNPQSATTVEKQKYAECIEYIYPTHVSKPMQLSTQVGLSLILLTSLILIIYGGIKGYKEDGPVMAIAGVIMGAVSALIIWGIVFGSAALGIYIYQGQL